LNLLLFLTISLADPLTILNPKHLICFFLTGHLFCRGGSSRRFAVRLCLAGRYLVVVEGGNCEFVVGVGAACPGLLAVLLVCGLDCGGCLLLKDGPKQGNRSGL
jgi:hypothetical protein